MKTWKVLLTVVLCSGMAFGFGLLGCGDDDDECRDACNKVSDCGLLDAGETVDDCTNGCNEGSGPEKDCALSCDRGASCEDYGLCLAGCGV